MLPINIDISGLVRQFHLSQEEIQDFSRLLVDMAADKYEKLWNDLVDRNLKSTRSVYKGAISKQRIDDTTIQFELEGKGDSKLAMMVEDGADPFDIKDGMRKSPKAKQKKDGGWYMTVPFRMATPEALAESQSFSGKMTDPIRNIAKEKGKVSARDLPPQLAGKEIRGHIQAPESVMPSYKREAYKHKHSIYEGIVRGTGKYYGQYSTFRRISDESDSNSWIHKGFMPRDFMGKAKDELSLNLDNIIKVATDSFLGVKFGDV